MKDFCGKVFEGYANLGHDLRAVTKTAEYVRKAGFINVTEKILKVPIGVWPKNKTLQMVGGTSGSNSDKI